MPNLRVSRVSLQCPTTKYPCSAQRPTAEYPCSVHCNASLQCPNPEYLGSVQGNVSLQCSNPQYLCSARWQSVLVLPSHCNAEPHSTCLCSAKVQCFCSAFAALQGKRFRRGAGQPSNALLYARTKDLIVVQLPVNDIGCFLSPPFGW